MTLTSREHQNSRDETINPEITPKPTPEFSSATPKPTQEFTSAFHNNIMGDYINNLFFLVHAGVRFVCSSSV